MRRPILALLFAALLCAPPSADAQFLKKLGQGLEKINKGLEKVEKTLSTDSDKKKESNKTASKKASTASNEPAAKPLNENGWQKQKAIGRTPYLTRNTLFINADRVFVSDVSDDVFALKNGGKNEFWRIDGTKLFDADWLYCSNGYKGTSGDFPLFVGGVTPARRASGSENIYLLYLDGHVKECPPNWESVSLFDDGVALVRAKINYNDKYFYINTAGENLPQPLCHKP